MVTCSSKVWSNTLKYDPFYRETDLTMPHMVPPDYGSNMKDSYWTNPDPGLEPVAPHPRELNRYGTRKTQRKENIYGYTGGGDATPREPGH